MAANLAETAKGVLDAAGGIENITNVTHCMTRLRLNVKDDAKVNPEEIKKIKGVIGYVHTGGQHQVIIGQTVDKVYKEFCDLGGFAAKEAVKENLDAPKEKLTPKPSATTS